MGNAVSERLEGHARHEHNRDEPGRDDKNQGRPASQAGRNGRMANAEHNEQREGRGSRCEDQERNESRTESCRCGGAGGMADADSSKSQQFEGERAMPFQEERTGSRNQLNRRGELLGFRDPGPTNGYWRDADWLFCRDEKWRPVRPGSFPLVDGAPARVGRLRGYGNAINAQVAKEVIMAVMAE